MELTGINLALSDAYQSTDGIAYLVREEGASLDIEGDHVSFPAEFRPYNTARRAFYIHTEVAGERSQVVLADKHPASFVHHRDVQAADYPVGTCRQ